MYTRLVIEVLFPNNFFQYLIETENKIRQLLIRLKYELNIFLERYTKLKQ